MHFHFFKDQVFMTPVRQAHVRSFDNFRFIQIPVGKQIIYIYKYTNKPRYDLGVEGFFLP